LLVHGWALDLDMWQPQLTGLAHCCRMVAFDRRGFGLSSGEPDIGKDVDDVLAILESLAIRRTAIVGMSQGARVALRFAQRFAERVSCLILDGPPWPHSTQETDELPMQRYRELVAEQGLEAFREQWLHHPFTQLHNGNASTAALLREIVARYPAHDLRHPEAQPITHELDVTGVDIPVLVINGVHDSAVRLAAGRELTLLLPNVRHSIVAGAGHLPNLDNPAVYNSLLCDFVLGHGSTARDGTRG
jgi:3-oxoadipate enol-lactonase